MSAIPRNTRKQTLSALNVRGGGPFGDATNRMIDGSLDGLATGKPVSHREARRRMKRAGGNATTKPTKKLDAPSIARRVVALPPSREATPPMTPPIAPPVTPLPWQIPGNHPVLIVRTLPGPPPKKYYGHFVACSREDVLVEETRTEEEDLWSVIYGMYGNDMAATMVGPVRVITLQAGVGQPGNAQFFYLYG
ncbi:hypothetical protein DFH06DRAFT_1304213 [Mycena polygramma]|nr:hypothetical protein DFH06DRAFT_1304213 [Mycena polygramma]